MQNARDAGHTWAEIGELLGTTRQEAGDYTVVDVPLRFEAAEMNGRVSYDRAGQVAGLYFLNQH